MQSFWRALSCLFGCLFRPLRNNKITPLSTSTSRSFDPSPELLSAARQALQELGEVTEVKSPRFSPSLVLVPVPGRMRLRVSNDHDGTHRSAFEHKMQMQKWGVEGLYQRKSEDENQCATMQLNVRTQTIQELTHRWAKTILDIKIRVPRNSSYAIQFIYLPFFLMTFVAQTTILVGYGSGGQSSYNNRCGITLTLLLTIMVTSVPDEIREVEQIKRLKGWSVNYVVLVIVKDIIIAFIWWLTLYYLPDAAEVDPYGHNLWRQFKHNFYQELEFFWWYRIW